MAVRGPYAMTSDLESVELGPILPALWNAQMYTQSESAHGKAEVRLPNADARLPLQKCASELEVSPESDQQSSFTPSLSPASSPLSLEQNQQCIGLSSGSHEQDVNELPRDLFPRGSYGRGDPSNPGIEAAKLRYQQEKLTRQQAAEAACATSRRALQSITATSESQGRPPTGMAPISSTSSTRKSGHRPVIKLPQETLSGPRRIDSTRNTSPSSFVPLRPLIHQRVKRMSNPTLSYNPPENTSQRYTLQHSYSPRLSSQINGRCRPTQEGWPQRAELSVKVFDLLPTTTTRDLYECFSREGNVVRIELYENSKGQREGKAVVRFSPPPARPFWEAGTYLFFASGCGYLRVRLHLDLRPRTFRLSSLVDHHNKYPEVMTMHAESLVFGMMLDERTMMEMCTALPNSDTQITFRQDMYHREIIVEFPMRIIAPRPHHGSGVGPNMGKYDRTDCFRFCIPFSQTKTINDIGTDGERIVLLITLLTPPKFFKMIDKAQSHDDASNFWKDRDAWYRQTDVVYDPNHLRKKSLTLQKTKPIIDLGRWTTYKLVLNMSSNASHVYPEIREALSDYNIKILPFPEFQLAHQDRPAVWRILDRPKSTTNGLDDLLQDSPPDLVFEVRYQLEVCISNGYLNEYNLSRAFIDKVSRMGVGHARDLLEYVATQGKPQFDPMALFRLTIGDGALLRSKIPHYCVHIRSATITPTTVHFHTPIAETSNRVIREYAAHADRFLRVRFTDEKFEGAIHSNNGNTMNEIFTRIKRVLTNGITIGDRHYEYLASGNSQFREHGAYFFAPLPNLPTEKIRKWMGLFSEIQTVPLYASRLGQCFSTTRAIHGAKATVVEIPDIERNGFNFTDGVGRISPFLARLTASELGIMQKFGEPPSVFQIRLGGCKGILAVSPSTVAREIHIRQSQYKFPAMHEGLEIVRWSQYACANLNRQLILILSALGVPDHVFLQKMRLQLSNLERAMTDERTALNILQKDVDHNKMTLAVASMILDGFQRSEEPFMISLLHLWRAWSIKYLKEKARITIGRGALLFGCVDETGILRGHFNDAPKPSVNASIEEKSKHVPQVFVQLSKGAGDNPEVILGPLLLARNPSLHPGDVRVVCGVNVPELHHLKDVVVLPQTGDRDVAGMCSGGDLDGDDFLVIWDHDLLPLEWNVEPMDYSRPPTLKHGHSISVDDLTTFFVTYMKNDTLARIANSHQAMADFVEGGVWNEKCLRLAALHSMAVDYVKTGQPAQMTRDLQPHKYPHFMNNEHRKPDQTYVSRKIVGQLYDQVEQIDFVPSFTLPFDDRILLAYDLDAEICQRASETKKEYDAHVRRIMAQHEIKMELEVWSTFVLRHTKVSNAFKFHEVIGELSMALKEQFRALCRERAGGSEFEQLGPFVAAMYKITSAEIASALKECQQFSIVGGQRRPLRNMTTEDMPLMSFPWLFPDVLGKIAKRNTLNMTGQLPMYEQVTLACETSGDPPASARVRVDTSRPRRERQGPSLLDADDDLETAGGVTHRGEVLELFEQSVYSHHLETDHKEKALLSAGENPKALASSVSGVPSYSDQGWTLGESSFGPAQLIAHTSPGAGCPSMSGSGDTRVSFPLSPSLSSEHSTPLVDLEEPLWVGGESYDDDGHDRARKSVHDGEISYGSNVRLLQQSISEPEINCEGSGRLAEKPLRDDCEPLPRLFESEGEPARPFEDEIQDETWPDGATGKSEAMEGRQGANGCDVEALGAEICFDIGPGLLHRLADIGADEPLPRLFKSEGEPARSSEDEILERTWPDGATGKSEVVEGRQGATGCDVEAPGVEICFDIEPGLLNKLADIGADEP